MTDSKLRALSAALEYWRQVAPVNWDYPHGALGGMRTKTGGNYAPEEVIEVATKFAAFLDGEKVKKRRGR